MTRFLIRITLFKLTPGHQAVDYNSIFSPSSIQALLNEGALFFLILAFDAVHFRVIYELVKEGIGGHMLMVARTRLGVKLMG